MAFLLQRCVEKLQSRKCDFMSDVIVKKDLLSLNIDALEQVIIDLGEKKFRSKQVYSWLHQKNALDFDAMTNVSKNLREKLGQAYSFPGMVVNTKQASKKDGTVKYLFELEDGQYIETVLMRYEHGNTVCISTQAGCRMGCTFCASGLLGLVRNLTVGEMLNQIYEIERDTGERVSNVVLMGTGEPLDNYESVLRFIYMITDEQGKNLSQRHITLSTCGLVDQIERLAEEGLQITLAISLHASSDEVRAKTMPIAKKYSIEQILKACQHYFDVTGRRISFEYGLIKGVNDSKEEALELGRLLSNKGFKCHVNLIPINTVTENAYEKSDKGNVYKFRDILLDHHIETTVRRSLGGDIDAACGQLRLRANKES